MSRDFFAEFQDAMRSSHNARWIADAYYGGDLAYEDLPVESGTITFTRTDMVRGKLSLRIADRIGDLVPKAPTDPLNVYGQEIRVRAGVEGPTSSQIADLGYYRIQSFKADERWTVHPNGIDWIRSGAAIDIEAMDRMANVVDARFITHSQPPPGATCLSEIERLTDGIVPWGGPMFGLTDKDVPAGLVYEDDRAAAIARLAAVMDCYCYVDDYGSLQVRSIAPTETSLVVGAGTNGVAISIDSTFSRDGVYNAVVARGEDSASVKPYSAVAYDNDPESPTVWGGPYGFVVGYFSSPFITTQAAARAVAKNRLVALNSGQEVQFTIQMVPDMQIVPDDKITLVMPSQSEIRVKVVEVSIPWGSLGPATLLVTANRGDLEAVGAG